MCWYDFQAARVDYVKTVRRVLMAVVQVWCRSNVVGIYPCHSKNKVQSISSTDHNLKTGGLNPDEAKPFLAILSK